MKISIIIPAYNEEENISKCLDSILQQTYDKEYEVIVVDDGSSDKTGEIVKKKAEKYRKIRYLRINHSGRAKARNEGLMASKGEVCIFIDADCVADPNWLRNITRHFERPETDAVFGKIEVLNKSDAFYPALVSFLKKKNPYYQYGEANIACRRNFLTNIGGWLTFSNFTAGDYESRLRIEKLGRIKYDPTAVIYSRWPTDIKKILKQIHRYGRAYIKTMSLHAEQFDLKVLGSLFYYLSTFIILILSIFDLRLIQLLLLLILIYIAANIPTSAQFYKESKKMSWAIVLPFFKLASGFARTLGYLRELRLLLKILLWRIKKWRFA